MRTGFRLKVDKDGLVFFDLRNLTTSEKVDMGKPRQRTRFLMLDGDGIRFERCLRALRSGDVVEVRFLPFLPKESDS